MLHARPPLTEAELDAVRVAFARAGIASDGRPPAYATAWRHTGAREAVDNQPVGSGYAPSPRRTRGATRA